jgi:hypothetical protein
MNRKHLFHAILVITLAILVTGCLNNQPTTQTHKVKTLAGTSYFGNHFSGGFGIITPEEVAKAASDGIQVAFLYNYPASPRSSLEQALKAHNMTVADAFISSQLYRYQRYSLCVTRHLSCSATYANETEAATYAAIRAHLQKVTKDKSLVKGYWVLDDQIDVSLYGALKNILQNIHKLIQQYTPGLPAICGFGTQINLGHVLAWRPRVALDFSPQGCDMVGLYVYASSSAKNPAPAATSYDWSMSKLLPAIFSSLQQQGWNITKTPLIGIGHAWGLHTGEGEYTALTPQSMVAQSISFCQHGAIGLAFYGWADSSFGATTQTPMNSPTIETGIRNSIAACRQYWSTHPQP